LAQILVCAALFLLPSRWADADSIADLEAALSCDKDFDPGALIHALQHDGWIATTRTTMLDGAPVFPVTKPLRIHGLEVGYVEGWDDRGDLFERAPGTPPPTYIAITVRAEAPASAAQFHASDPFDRLQLWVTDDVAAFNGRRSGFSSVACGFSR
jgi:hypothetical protein